MRLFRRRPIVRATSAADVRVAVDAGAAVIDVRTQEEWDAGHLPFARHLPLEDVEARIGELDPGKLSVFVCRSGNRSGVVAKALASRGYSVANLVGGMNACRREGLPVVRSDGSPGRVI